MCMRMRKRCIRFLCLSVCPSACVLQPLPCNLFEKNIFHYRVLSLRGRYFMCLMTFDSVNKLIDYYRIMSMSSRQSPSNSYQKLRTTTARPIGTTGKTRPLRKNPQITTRGAPPIDRHNIYVGWICPRNMCLMYSSMLPVSRKSLLRPRYVDRVGRYA